MKRYRDSNDITMMINLETSKYKREIEMLNFGLKAQTEFLKKEYELKL